MPVTAAGTRRFRSGPLPPRGRTRGPGACTALVAATVAFVTLAGCAPLAPQPPAAPPAAPTTRPPRTASSGSAGAAAASTTAARARPTPGYAGLKDSLGAVDGAVLRGRRIAIDPGHGGFFKGCVGVNGLTEADVNLAVALHLRSLLVAQGAEVLLTRDRDRDFLTPSDSTLKTDLAARASLANAFAPDLFVSIHHNADPGGGHDVNETQTYYKLGDEGPSYDAATDVHRSLVRNVGIEVQRLLPGNFAVVRGVDAPALLTESSYLTDPDVEARLSTPEGPGIEAGALFLGIARFFARRAPEVSSLAFAPATASGPARPGAADRPGLTARIRGPFDDVDLVVDGARANPLRFGDSLAWHPGRPLVSGDHVAELRVRLAGEGASRARRLAFRVDKPARRIVAEFPLQPAWNGRYPLGLRVRVVDEDGLVLRDTLSLRVRTRLAAPADTIVATRDGEAWIYYRPVLRGRSRFGPVLTFRIARHPRLLEAGGIASPPDGSVTIAQWLTDSLPTRTTIAREMPADVPLRDAPGTVGIAPEFEWLNRDGFAALAVDSLGHARVPRLPGFRTWGADSLWPPRFVPIAQGGLRGRRIVLDPEGGGDDAAGVGPSGTRAATLNLEVARALAGMLEAAGADVLLTRQGDAALSEVERVQRGEGFRAERYLRIGHAPAPPVAGHYFASGGGHRWALGVARACAELGLADSLLVTDVAKYALTQSSATALYASLARVDSAASEARLLAPGALRAEAYALYLALAREFAPDAQWTTDSLEVRDADGRPVAGAPVTLGGVLVLQTGADGRARFARTEPGPLDAFVHDPRPGAHTVLLDSDHGRVLPGGR